MNLNVNFPYLYPHQQDVFDAVKEDNGRGKAYVVKARRQCGKSILAITLLLYFAFKDEGSIGYCLEPTLHQGRLIYKNVIRAIGGEDSPAIKSSNATLLEIEFINGSRILFRSAEQREALRGATVRKSILIIDEASFIQDDIIDILLPIVDANRCPVLFISTPLFRSGRFYERYRDGQKENNFVVSFDWATGYDLTMFLSPEKLEYYRNTMTEMKFRSEILGQFLDELSYVFGDVNSCVGQAKKPAVYCGVDWSQGGDGDYTVAVFFDEDKAMTDIKFWKDFEPVELVEVLAAEINDRSSLKKVQVEKNSLGHIFYDMLKRAVKVPVREFITTNESKRRVVEQLIKGFEEKDITIIDDKELKRELQHYGIEKLKNGSYTYNGQNGVNDDAVIATALAYDLFPRVHREKKIDINFA